MDEELLLFLLLLVLFYSLILLRPFSNKRINLPPGPTPWPVIGNILQLGKNPHISLANMAREHGPLISLRLGTQLVIVASSPTTAAEILKTHDRIFSARYIPQTYRVKRYIGYSLAFSFECDERWKSLRSICKGELFTTRMLDVQADWRQKKVDEMVSSLLGKKGEEVTIGEMVFASAFNILGNSFFSQDVFNLENENSGASGLKHDISRILQLGLAPNLADFYPSLGWMDIQGLNREAGAFVNRIYGIWEGFIKERREKDAHNNTSRNFLDVLLSAGCSDMQTKALILDMFVAGTDTITTLVDWTMAELVRNPKVMQKLKDELEQVVVGGQREGENAVNESYLIHLTYLQACIKESLRLHPPVPLLLPRQALDDRELMNYTIPKDCRLMVNVWAIGRDPDIWKDPLTFSPERFLNSSIDYKGNDFELIPFGAGRRMCPGIPLASRVVELILASLIQTFDWSLPHGMEPSDLNMEEKFGLTLEREQPLRLIPKPLV